MSYTQLYDPVTPLEALSGAKIAFREYSQIFLFKQRISKPKLLGCTDFP